MSDQVHYNIEDNQETIRLDGRDRYARTAPWQSDNDLVRHVAIIFLKPIVVSMMAAMVVDAWVIGGLFDPDGLETGGDPSVLSFAAAAFATAATGWFLYSLSLQP
ncbi:hypothetical protein B0T25DRAFT_363998 [Lasiosphaeria hispida]|uniref:Uncharacterized protein n=1 Tax=Lasiosphaeria hispida TaxID=260671 RepID=A0AAJ0M7N4_9PEZI|nr:hypothetical protein B0T25DRAFT_363998 [Lasiosphaeria hispida]